MYAIHVPPHLCDISVPNNMPERNIIQNQISEISIHLIELSCGPETLSSSLAPHFKTGK
jgi:hypothetical protein